MKAAYTIVGVATLILVLVLGAAAWYVFSVNPAPAGVSDLNPGGSGEFAERFETSRDLPQDSGQREVPLVVPETPQQGIEFTSEVAEEETMTEESTITVAPLTLASGAFQDGGTIPTRFTCDGNETSPPLAFGGVPEGAVSLALIVDDPDVPKALRPEGVYDHWVLFNISPGTTMLAEGGSAGVVGASSNGRSRYVGPCPPREYEPSEHRYFFRLYALDTTLNLPGGATKQEVLAAMQGHVLAEAELMGRYKRP